MLKQLDNHMQKKLDTVLIPFTKKKKKNSGEITDLNVENKTVKFLEDIIGENLDDLGKGHDFLDTISKADP